MKLKLTDQGGGGGAHVVYGIAEKCPNNSVNLKFGKDAKLEYLQLRRANVVQKNKHANELT